jgi:hypothetical protein
MKLRGARGRAWSLVKGHYGWLLALLGVVLSAAALYFTLSADTPLSAEEQELLSLVPPKVGWHCHREEMVDDDPDRFSYPDLVRAAVECAPTDPGPESVKFLLFTTEAGQRRYMHGVAAKYSREGFGCEGAYFPRERWIDSRGRERGDLLCADGDTRSVLVWSDRTSNLVGSASSRVSAQPELHRWWQRSVKFEGDGAPRKARGRLLSQLPDGFGACRPDDEIPPGALIAVSCSPGGGISSAGAALFADRKRLDAYLQAFADIYSGATEKGCNRSTYSFTTYGPGSDGKPTQGNLLCFVNDGAQWFLWSAHRPLVYAYLARDDENWRKLFDAWTNSLSHIRGLAAP